MYHTCACLGPIFLSPQIYALQWPLNRSQSEEVTLHSYHRESKLSSIRCHIDQVVQRRSPPSSSLPGLQSPLYATHGSQGYPQTLGDQALRRRDCGPFGAICDLWSVRLRGRPCSPQTLPIASFKGQQDHHRQGFGTLIGTTSCLRLHPTSLPHSRVHCTQSPLPTTKVKPSTLPSLSYSEHSLNPITPIGSLPCVRSVNGNNEYCTL